MNIKGKIKIVVQAYKKVHGKKGIAKKIIKVFFQKGLPGLKRAIIDIYRRETNVQDIYDYQQQHIPQPQKVYGSVTVIIEIPNSNVDILGTVMSLKNQTLKSFEVKLIVPKGYAANDEYEKVYYSKFPGEVYKTVIDGIRSDYFVIVNGSNILHTDALMLLVESARSKKDIFIYCDECIFDGGNGSRIKYFIKPDYSQVYQDASLYIEQGVMFPSIVSKNIENFMGGNLNFFARIQLAIFDILKCCNTVNHVKYILLLRNSFAEEQNLLQNMYVIQQNLYKKDLLGTAFYKENKYLLSLVQKNYKVSIVICAQEVGRLTTCIDSILKSTDYLFYEIIIVSQIIDIKGALSVYSNFLNIKNINVDSLENFNYSKLCNIGAKEASGEIVVFIKETVGCVNNSWLKEIVSCFEFKNIGAVSPKILRQDNTIQYAGIISGGFGFFPIPFNGDVNVRKEGVNDYAFLNREVSVLSATCLAVRRSVFLKINGFNEVDTPDKFSNADLSFKIRDAGLNCFYCAESTIFTCDSDWYDSWFEKDSKGAYLYILRNYVDRLEYDPYFTDYMKYCFLKNIPNDYAFYSGSNSTKHARTGRAILLVSHDLLLTGAPIALYYAAKTILDNGDYPVVISPYDGSLRKELTKDGIDVVIDPTINGDSFWTKWAKNFDLIIVNTLVQYNNIKQLNNCNIPVVWWVHEAKESYIKGAYVDIPNEIGKNISVYCAGSYAKKMLKEYRPLYNANELLYCVPDYSKEANEIDSYKLEDIQGKVVFLIIGTIEKRKGQDIFAKAVMALPDKYIKRCRFFIIGKKVEDNIYDEVVKLKNLYPQEVTLINEVSRNEMRSVFSQSNAVICASRDDPMPVFMTECFMFSKIAICSENTGTASLIADGVNGFVYGQDNSEELKEKIIYVIDNYNSLNGIETKGRTTYERYFTEKVFGDNISSIINSILTGGLNGY